MVHTIKTQQGNQQKGSIGQQIGICMKSMWIKQYMIKYNEGHYKQKRKKKQFFKNISY